MDSVQLTRLMRDVQSHLQHAVNEVFPAANWCVPLPWCFGSQKYRLTGPKSDVDLLVLAPDAIVEQAMTSGQSWHADCVIVDYIIVLFLTCAIYKL